MSEPDPHVEVSRRRHRRPDAGDEYGRLFADLPSESSSSERLAEMSRANALLSGREDRYFDLANPRIPSGFVFFGQFVAHDVTHERAPLTVHVNELQYGGRVPRLDLETLYGFGPFKQQYLYDREDPARFLLGVDSDGRPIDLLRNDQGRAIIVDPRNDQHVFVAQLEVAFQRFHNRLVDVVGQQQRDRVFEEAQRLTRWHYQYAIVHEYLPLTVGEDMVRDVLTTGPRVWPKTGRPSVPVEFADAAFRFGHAQVWARYDVNEQSRDVALFPDLAGGRALPSEHAVDWRNFFAIDPSRSPNPSRRITPRLAPLLLNLPEEVFGHADAPEYASLAYFDLARGRSMRLPSGEAIAGALGERPVTEPGAETPLWLYILREAQELTDGEHLGPVGGRIVAEVLIGLLRADRSSFLSAEPDWRPELAGSGEAFGMAEIIRFAGLAEASESR